MKLNCKFIIIIFLTFINHGFAFKVNQTDLKYVFPQGEKFIEINDKIYYWKVYKKGEFAGICYVTTDIDKSVKGFVDYIHILVGVDTNKSITGIKVLEHREDIPEANKITEKWFENQFKGKTIYSKFEIGEDIDGITGATITSRAVAKSIKITLKKISFLLNKEKIKKKSPYKVYILLILILFIEITGYFILTTHRKLDTFRKKILYIIISLLLLSIIIIGTGDVFKKKEIQKNTEIKERPRKSKTSLTPQKEEIKKEELILRPKHGIEKVNLDEIEKQIKSGNLSKKEAYNYTVP